MTTLYYDADAHLERLTGRRVAILGGASGTAHITLFGADTINLFGGATTINANTGSASAHITGGSGATYFINGALASTLFGGSGQVTAYAGAGGGSITGGTNGGNRIYGGSGDVTITGAGNYDYLEGGSGNSTVIAGTGTEFLALGTGNTTLIGSVTDNDILNLMQAQDFKSYVINAYHVGDLLYVADQATVDYAVAHETVGGSGLTINLSANKSILLTGITTTVSGSGFGHS